MNIQHMLHRQRDPRCRSGCPCSRSPPEPSPTAWARGTGQKVVSFSSYTASLEQSQDRQYFEGISDNVALVEQHYGVDWTLRVYHDSAEGTAELDALCLLGCSLPSLCYAGDLPGTPATDVRQLFPMVLRFLPTLNPQVKLLKQRPAE